MNTPAHVIFSLSLLGRTNASRYPLFIAAGALLPDALMMVFYAYEKLRGVPESTIWEEHYFLPFWQNIFDISNSIPLLVIGICVSLALKKSGPALLFGSMVVHCVLDFAVHNDDAHLHFYPFSDYRFSSPISYWDPQYHGNLVGMFEMLFFVAGVVYLWVVAPKRIPLGPESRLHWVVLLTSIIYAGFFYFVVRQWAQM